MLSALGSIFFVVFLLDGEFADVMVDSLLPKGGTLEEADIVEGSGVVVCGGMRLTPISYNVLHQFYSSHGLQGTLHRDTGLLVVSKKNNS